MMTTTIDSGCYSFQEGFFERAMPVLSLGEGYINADRLSLFPEFFNDEYRDSITPDIRIFLFTNEGLGSYLSALPFVVRKYFGDARLNLELVKDTESETEQGTLFVNISSQYPLSDAMDRLAKLTKEWLIPVVGQYKNLGKFNVDIEVS